MNHLDQIANKRALAWGWPDCLTAAAANERLDESIVHTETLACPDRANMGETVIKIGSLNDGRWTYTVSIALYSTGQFAPFSIMWCDPFLTRQDALNAAIAYVEGQLTERLGDPSLSKRDITQIKNIGRWLDSMTAPKQLSLFGGI